MRDYIQFQALSRAPRGLLGAIKQAITNWRLRKDLALLLNFSDYQLRDIGLTHHELLHLIRRPIDCDVKWELEQLCVDASAVQGKAQQRHEVTPIKTNKTKHATQRP